MLARNSAFFAVAFSLAVARAATSLSYAEAEVAWKQVRDRPQYQSYVAEFTQYNNSLHLDDKDGCYKLSPGPVNLFLVITHTGSSEFAVVERVLSSVDNPKARCFMRTYEGLRTKVPPFLPFVLQMGMG